VAGEVVKVVAASLVVKRDTGPESVVKEEKKVEVAFVIPVVKMDTGPLNALEEEEKASGPVGKVGVEDLKV